VFAPQLTIKDFKDYNLSKDLVLRGKSMLGATLVKAKLLSEDGGGTITFMFNPEKITISSSMELNRDNAARTAKGLPKVTFAYPNPKKITISSIYFDTYETGQSVLPFIAQFENALNFVTAEKRPPTYKFIWGSQEYIRCFIDKLDYDLTMFLPDGTPVRAVINSLTLNEIDESISPAPTSVSNPSATQRGTRSPS
jgi:hypothetical protein